MNLLPKTFALALTLCLFATSTTAFAQFVSTADRGTIRSDGITNVIGNMSFFTGVEAVGADPLLDFRSWFLFDVPNLPTESFLTATLELENPNGGIEVLNSALDLTVFEFQGDVANLVSGSNGLSNYFDLGIGTVFGQTTINEVDFRSGGTVEIELNAAGVNALNLAEGNQIAFGLSLAPTTPDNHIFGFTNETFSTGFSFETIPEPVSGTLLTLGLVAGIAYRRRK